MYNMMTFVQENSSKDWHTLAVLDRVNCLYLVISPLATQHCIVNSTISILKLLLSFAEPKARSSNDLSDENVVSSVSLLSIEINNNDLGSGDLLPRAGSCCPSNRYLLLRHSIIMIIINQTQGNVPSTSVEFKINDEE